MAKGSVRKKGKKWYYRFYVENESGKLIQREFVGTESKAETEAMLRKAMEDYEAQKFVAKPENLTLGDMLDLWVEEELKPGNLSNGTVMAYQGTVRRIKAYPHWRKKAKEHQAGASAAVLRPSELRRKESGRHHAATDLARIYEALYGGDAKRIPLRSISQETHRIQSYAVCTIKGTEGRSGSLLRK